VRGTHRVNTYAPRPATGPVAAMIRATMVIRALPMARDPT
jgi:hypothetical protein